MNRFKAFVIKEFRHIWRDPKTMLILFALPVAQILIFGFVISNEIKQAPIAILDLANDAASKKLIGHLTSTGYLYEATRLQSEAEIETEFRQNRVKMVVVIPPHFGSDALRAGTPTVQLIADASDANSAQLLASYGETIIHRFVANEFGAGGKPLLGIEMQMLFNPTLEGVYMSVPGIMAMVLILISAMMTSISITREKEFGTMEVLLVSPLKPFQIILGKVAPYLLLSFVNCLVILWLSTAVFGVPVNGSWGLLLWVCMLYIMLSLSLGILISTVAPNQMVAMFISMFGLMLPTILLSGFIFPVENMPLVLQWLSAINPPRWFVEAIKTIMMRGGGMADIAWPVAILLAFLLLFVGMSIRKFKIRLE